MSERNIFLSRLGVDSHFFDNAEFYNMLLEHYLRTLTQSEREAFLADVKKSSEHVLTLFGAGLARNELVVSGENHQIRDGVVYHFSRESYQGAISQYRINDPAEETGDTETDIHFDTASDVESSSSHGPTPIETEAEGPKEDDDVAVPLFNSLSLSAGTGLQIEVVDTSEEQMGVEDPMLDALPLKDATTLVEGEEDYGHFDTYADTYAQEIQGRDDEMIYAHDLDDQNPTPVESVEDNEYDGEEGLAHGSGYKELDDGGGGPGSIYRDFGGPGMDSVLSGNTKNDEDEA